MEANEIWAYRETGKHPLQPVRFLRHRRNTNKNNAHAHIRFEDPDADGLETWVPTGRLKCLWADAETFIGHEQRWAKVLELSRGGGALTYATERVWDLVPDESAACIIRSRSDLDGVFEFKDAEALATATRLSVDEVCSSEGSFEEDGVWVVPLATAAIVAERLAFVHPGVVIRDVEREEQELASIRSEWALRHPSVSPAQQTDDEWEMREHSIAIRRKWVGEEAMTLRDEAVAAQQESERLRNLVMWAIKKLGGYGHKSSAETLRRNLDAG